MMQAKALASSENLESGNEEAGGNRPNTSDSQRWAGIQVRFFSLFFIQ